MIDPAKVKGQKLLDLFSELIAKKTIISMQIVGTGFERLTCVTGITREQKINCLLIDLPDGFKAAAAKSEQLCLRFNFNGPDRLEYFFATQDGVCDGNTLKVPFPEFVDRLQRRRNFRLNAPPGALISFKINQIQGVVGMINISLGGAYGALLKHNVEGAKGSILRKNQCVLNLSLFFPADGSMPDQVINIRRSEIRRVERDKDRRLFKYAFEFMDIDKNEHKKLTRAIYHMQRQQLQRR